MDFSAQNPATSTPLSLAARNNDVDSVERLLQVINPNCADNRGWTCLHEAAYQDSYESLMLILKSRRTRVLAETHEGHTALYLACRNECSFKTILALLKSRKNIANYGSTELVTPLHVASIQGNVPLIKLLLEFGAILNVQDYDGDTPLHETAVAAKHDALIALLYSGADPEIKNKKGFTPFHLACSKGYYPNIESLCPFVSDINEQTNTGDTALHFAVYGGAGIDVINFLLDHGADPNILNDRDELPIDVDWSDVEVFKKLFSVTPKENLREDVIVDACLPHKYDSGILETLLNSELEPRFFNLLTPFNTLFNRDYLSHTQYSTISPLNNFLGVSEYIYEQSPVKFKEFLYLMLMQGANVNIVDELDCPPLVYSQIAMNEAHDSSEQQIQYFKELLEILVQIGCDVDYTSDGKFNSGHTNIPDAFLTSLDVYPVSAPIMMPYSLYNEPQDYLRFAIQTDRIFVVPMEVQDALLDLVDKNFPDIESLDFFVPSLQHLCRYAIRKHFRQMRNQNGERIEFTTPTFLRAIDALPLPTFIKRYLRYFS